MSTVLTSSSIELLTGDHDLTAFDCGEAARNTWLVKRALPNQEADYTRTYVLADGPFVLGFYALSVSSIVRGSVPSSMRRNAPDPLSSVLLAQLGVDLSHQRQGLSKELVIHAMAQAVRIADLAGCRLFTVSPARPELVTYYAKFGLVEIDAVSPLMAMTLAKTRATLTKLADALAQP